MRLQKEWKNCFQERSEREIEYRFGGEGCVENNIKEIRYG